MADHDFDTLDQLIDWASAPTEILNRRHFTAPADDSITVAISRRAEIQTRIDARTSSVDHGPEIRAFTDEQRHFAVAHPDSLDRAELDAAVARLVESIRVAQGEQKPATVANAVEATRRWREAVQAAEEAEAARDDAIRAALADGASAPKLSAHIELSTARIYQIRDRRR